jgi:hypothetical protein
MKKGKEPLRTFGDLLQFYELKQQPDEKPRTKQPEVNPPEMTAEQTAPPVAEMPQANEEAPPMNGETMQTEMPTEHQAVEPQTTPMGEIPMEQSKPDENG